MLKLEEFIQLRNYVEINTKKLVRTTTVFHEKSSWFKYSEKQGKEQDEMSLS